MMCPEGAFAWLRRGVCFVAAMVVCSVSFGQAPPPVPDDGPPVGDEALSCQQLRDKIDPLWIARVWQDDKVLYLNTIVKRKMREIAAAEVELQRLKDEGEYIDPAWVQQLENEKIWLAILQEQLRRAKQTLNAYTAEIDRLLKIFKDKGCGQY